MDICNNESCPDGTPDENLHLHQFHSPTTVVLQGRLTVESESEEEGYEIIERKHSNEEIHRAIQTEVTRIMYEYGRHSVLPPIVEESIPGFQQAFFPCNSGAICEHFRNGVVHLHQRNYDPTLMHESMSAESARKALTEGRTCNKICSRSSRRMHLHWPKN